MNPFHQEEGPGPRTLTGRHARLNESLAGLGGKVREMIAGTVGQAAGDAVRAAVRSLLGEPGPFLSEESAHHVDADDPWESDHGVEEGTPPFRMPLRPSPNREPALPDRKPSRWRGVVAAVQSALWWLRRQRTRRPVATTSLVAVAAALAALLAGPALAACAGVAASAVGLLVTADGASSLAEGLSTLLV